MVEPSRLRGLVIIFGPVSFDTMTDIGRDEARVVEPFDPTSLCSDVNQINATAMGLAGSVNAALMKFQHVDTHLEELHNIQ